MPVDPYQNCPCGSGKKFKWCCQKVAKFAEKAEQLLEKDQPAAALQALDEGLAIEPDNLWLRTLKAQMLLSEHDHERAYPLLDQILESHPGYRPALVARLQDELSHGLTSEAADTLQAVLDATPVEEIEEAIAWTGLAGRAFAQVGEAFAALKYLRFAATHERFRPEIEQDGAFLEANSEIGPWLREPHELQPPPETAGAHAAPWREALDFSAAGRWGQAAKIFQGIVDQQPDIAAAWYNLGLCHCWLVQNEAAALALERYGKLEPDIEHAVQALCLAQSLFPRESAQCVDVVQVRYPIRDQTRLIQRFKEHSRLQVHKLDAKPGELAEGVKDEFYLLDRDFVKDASAITLENIPAIIGVVRTREQNLELEFADPVPDDARLATLREAAGDSVDPDGQRETVGTIPISMLRLRRMWGIQSDASYEAMHRIRRIVNEHNYREVWPDTPSGWLENKTPREAAQIPELRRSLRATVLIVEYSNEASHMSIDMNELRDRLGIEREELLEGDGLEIERLPLSRLRQVLAESLSTPRLKVLFERSSRFRLPLAMQNAAAALVSRPADRDQFDCVTVFRVLIDFACMRADRASAAEWLGKARAFDTEAGLQPPRPTWNIVEWQIAFQFDRMADWAPRLAALLQRYSKDKETSTELMSLLMRFGLVRMLPHPSDPNRAVLDTRLVDQILAYSARQPGSVDLTPVADGQGSGIWTPASESPAGSSPIILPGQEAPSGQRAKIVIPGT